ncbi:hypothetical protein MTBBW1_2380012 [Desulfamplus magnetovallimortis]|uniref:Uncharacterized protein n=1 Tax=Desulfamplus magnetovallimortis TaxID=1246637 RepID=A0A1W1HE69_9BACT|nr:hypothetical protein MTBBW1_2380012 [Desulfamplus magnetovallimortis]
MTATIEEMKVVLKTACYRDFHIKLAHSPRPQTHFTDLGGGVWVS